MEVGCGLLVGLGDYLPVAHEAPEYVAGIGMVAMAAALVAYRFSDRLNRAFALFLVVGGVEHIWAALDNTEAIRGLAVAMLGYFRVATLFALVYLAARYAEHRGKLRFPRWGSGLLLGGVVLLEGAYLLGHLGYLGGTEPGLLLLAWPLRVVASAVVGLFFAREALASAEAPAGGDLLAATAFSVEPAAILIPYLDIAASGVEGGWIVPVFLAGFILAGLVAVATAIWLALRGSSRGTRRASATILVAAASTLLLFALPSAWDDAVWGVWQLALPVLLGYAILQHQLFDIDARIRWGVSRSTVAAVFVAVFFVVSEGAQVVFSGFAGSELFGVIGAGALVFVLAPLQRFGDHVAKRTLPPDRGSGDDGGLERYRTALRMALADGSVSPQEERELAELARDLGLDPVRRLEIRQEVEQSLGADLAGAPEGTGEGQP